MIRFTHHQLLEGSYWKMACRSAMPIAKSYIPFAKRLKGAF